MRIITSLFFFFFFNLLSAQEILVLDKETKEPLFNVTVFNESKTKSTLTDYQGEVNLSIFSPEEEIFFRHISHLEFQTTKEEILKRKNIVLLERDENELEEVVLSVSKFRQRKEDIPQKIISISREEIIFSNPQTTADLLQTTGQVYVQKSQLGGGSPMIRGFATNRLLITVDGVRMNTAIFRGGNVQNIISIDPFAIERTEVVVGPGSVVYGSDAIGGVINFYTLSPEFSYTGETDFSGSALARYSTANNEKTGHLHFSIGKENWAFLTSASYSDFGDLRMGSNGPEEYLRTHRVIRSGQRDIVIPNEDPLLQVPSGYDQINLLQKIRFKPNYEWDFSLGLIYSATSNYPRYDRLYRKREGEFASAEWYYGPQRWFLGNFQINKKGEGALYDEAKFTGAYQKFGESRNDRNFGEEILFETKTEVDVYSANLDFEKDFSQNKLFYGLEYVINKVHSFGRETNIITSQSVPGASRYPDGSTWQSLAAYGSFQMKISPDLSFQTGARYNHILVDASFDEEIYDLPFSEASLSTGALTGSAGLVWEQSETLNWQFNLSTAFRAPNIDDIGKVFDSEPGSVVVPNPNLEPEYAYNAELGLNLNFDEVVRLNLTGYYTYLDNALVRRDFSLGGKEIIEYQGEPSRVQAIQNAAFAVVYGFEFGGEIHFTPRLELNSHLSVIQGEEEQEDGTTAPLRHAAPLFGDAHLRWENPKLIFDFYALFNGAFSYEELAPSEQGKPYLYAIDPNGNPYSPSWTTLNFTTQYKFSENWKATASLQNITDQRYRTYSSGISAAGRNLILALKYSF